MKTMVVLFALAAVACGSLIPLAQPIHHSAVVLDPHGRPLDTAEVINARALHLQAKALEGHYAPLVHAAVAPVAHSVVAAPAAVSHQSRVDVRTSPAIVSHAVAAPLIAHGAYASPVLAHSAYASPLLAHGLVGHGHLLKKRSLGHLAYSAPIIAPSAVSHQSRVDVISSPAVVSHAVAAPLVAHSIAAPIVAVAPSAVSHQSRVDVHTSPAIVSHAVASPVLAHSAYAPSVLTHSAYASPFLAHGFTGHGHLLKKRSLGHLAYSAPIIAVAPSAVSHQSRIDLISNPAVVSHAVVAPVVSHVAPIAVAHAAVVPAAVSHQARVDVISSPAHVSPLAYSTAWAAPAAHLSHSGLLHAAQW